MHLIMKTIDKVSILCILALAVSCGQKDEPAPVKPEPQPETRTLTFVLPSIDLEEGEEAPAALKTAWEAGDQIVVHGEYARDQVTVTLAAGDISADGKTASVELSQDVTDYYADPDGLYAAWPAQAVKEEDALMSSATTFEEFLIPLAVAFQKDKRFEFVDAEIVKEGASRYFRIYIDKPGGITLNDCESYHRRVIPLVDQVDYDFLEVCSPGLDRPLKKEKDFRAHMGDRVEVHLYRPRGGKKVFEGELTGFEGSAFTIAEGDNTETFELKEVSLCRPVVVITEDDLNGNIVNLITEDLTEE